MSSDVKFPRLLPRSLRPTPQRLVQARRFAEATFGDKLQSAHEIPGWLHADQAAMLCHIAHLCPAGPIVEIGSFKGKSTMFIGMGMKPTNTLTAIDPHLACSVGSRADRKRAGIEGDAATAVDSQPSWERFHQTLRDWNLADRVTVARDYSHNYRPKWTGPIAFLWIDGDHTYEAVKQDIADWADLVVPNGFIGFHDTHHHYAGDGTVRRAIIDSGVLSQRGFSSYLELRNAWFMQRAG